MNPVMHMERVMEDYIVTFKSDVIHDGIIIGKYGEDETYLWLVRQSGTDIFCLNDIQNKEIAIHFIERSERMFIMQNMYDDLNHGGVFFEIPKEITFIEELVSPLNTVVTAYQESKSAKISRDNGVLNFDVKGGVW